MLPVACTAFIIACLSGASKQISNVIRTKLIVYSGTLPSHNWRTTGAKTNKGKTTKIITKYPYLEDAITNLCIFCKSLVAYALIIGGDNAIW